jgi:serine/threonine-protein kinase
MLASAAESRGELTPGTSYSPPPAFGRFKLLHQIGAGVLGPVFRTHDPDHDRLVAVKAFTLDFTPEQASALAAEFERLAALGIEAPCLAAPIAAGMEEFVPYVAVPYVSGESLDAAVRQYGPAPAGDAIRLIAHVADALDAASAAGVHHGSLHPRDVIVTPGETHVTGIGVAQALERVGLHGPVRRPYVAPEREGGDEWGAPADIYALAAIAYEVLTGRRALPGTDQPLPGLIDLRVHDVAALRDVIEAALDADPARRPARAGDFAAGFAAALSESAAAGAGADRSADRRARRPRTRPPKLPGLDEPLAAPESAAKARARGALPAEPVPPAPVPSTIEEPAPAELAAPVEAAPPGPGPAVTEAVISEPESLRYVPVTDPTDAGDVVGEPVPEAPRIDEAASEVVDRPEAPGEAAVPIAPPARLASGLTPDLRLADELMSRADAAGETVDAALAAALDRLSPEDGANPTPVALGLDLPGPGVLAEERGLDSSGAGVAPDLAAETLLSDEAARPAAGPVSEAATSAPAPDQADGAQRPLVLRAPELQTAPVAEAKAAPPGAGDVARAPRAETPPAEAPGQPPPERSGPPSELLRPYARGRGAERRRPSPRFGRFDPLTPTPATTPAGPQGTGVPRAFGEGRPTPLPRPVPDFDLLTRPEPSRLPLIPVLIGVIGGLIVGLAGGYWLGSRSVSPAPVQAARTAPPGAAQEPAAAAAPKPLAPPATAPPAEPGPSPAAPAAQPASAPPPAPVETVPRPATAARGSIRVTASQQANVFLDGQRQGMTPRNIRNVPLGRHTIRVTRPGYATHEETVVLTSEEPSAEMSFTLRRAGASAQAGTAQAPAFKSVLVVIVESNPPGARIRIDGRDLAPTPLTIRQLRPGTHTLELRLPGYRTWTQRITVAAGDERRITATLERDAPR